MSASTQSSLPSQTRSESATLTKNGEPLKRSLARALRREKLRALLMIAPLLLFVFFSFVMPIGDMLFRSVENNIVEDTIPGTVRALVSWDSGTGELPPEAVYAALADDMMLAQEKKIHTRLGSRLNYDQPGISSVFRKSGRRIKKLDNEAAKSAFVAINPAWETPEAWNTLRAMKAWPAQFPATAQSWKNWAAWLKSEEGDDADPAAIIPYGFSYAALYHDLAVMPESKITSFISGNNAEAGALFEGLPGNLATFPSDDFKTQFADIDKGWLELDNWQAIKRLSPTIVDSYFLASIDAERTEAGIESKPENERIYLTLFVRTIFLSMAITFSCILLGYPVAYLLANLSVKASNMVLILVLLPFWTSLLVRTSAWKVLLQQQGVINDLLVWAGIISDAGRLVMINNMTGTIIAMTHILLPFMILPLFSVMKTISPTYMRAARSMGASDSMAFWRIYFPNTVPGIGAGSILVFILSIGYYITPELVGGTKGVFISNRIAYHISSSLNWGLAAALGSILLVLVMALYWTYDRIVGIDNVKLG
ncbi:ABC transporter permease [Granulosicoccus antarcticus]|uniref:Spermidine/putrescine transport system permease protein PotB n=1 Tax=Granulosicoccus antarcticus IMCC3135 TaxID=1192854 RepID=A0A2Z2NLX3_9GAMM|nr:ABC transporter permease [Granulosicoccus antarcticus]ASJ71545.1 Spermidine/putrescine transport system permease protein PotB [Granulosicoccus antarcticus IMCC3135]